MIRLVMGTQAVVERKKVIFTVFKEIFDEFNKRVSREPVFEGREAECRRYIQIWYDKTVKVRHRNWLYRRNRDA